jgi:HlyD family secretion protein
MNIAPNSSQSSIRWHLMVGGVVAFVLVGGLARWAWTAELAGAVIAPGVVVVDSSAKRVQHPTGGVVAEINVRNDDHVKAGEVLVRLDATQTRANVAMYGHSLDELQAKKARLEAEKNSADSVSFPDELLARENQAPDVAHILADERKLFSLRVQARNGQKAQLRERADQLRLEISGYTEQIDAKSQEIDLIKQELEGVTSLWEKKLTPFARLVALRREAARLEGERGRLVATRAASGGKIAEIELQIIQVDEDARSKTAEELSDVRAKIAELSERKVAAEDQLKRVDIIAPQAGRVLQSAVHTVGRVIEPGETLMLIVPDNDALSIEAKVSPDDIDQLHPNQPVFLRFSAFNRRTTPEIGGSIKWISADVTEDDRTKKRYYVASIVVTNDQLKQLGKLKIVPGMPVEAFIQTGSRTAISYFLKPLSDQVMRSFREG